MFAFPPALKIKTHSDPKHHLVCLGFLVFQQEKRQNKEAKQVHSPGSAGEHEKLHQNHQGAAAEQDEES